MGSRMPEKVVESVAGGGSGLVLIDQLADIIDAWTGIALTVVLITYYGYLGVTKAIDRQKNKPDK